MILTRRQTLLGAAALALTGTQAQAAHTLAGHAFGSTWRIVTDRDDPALRQTIDQILTDIDRTMSPYRAASDVTRFNTTRTTGWQTVSASTAHVTQEALRIADLTGGAFDPTVGPLVGRYGFGPITGDLGSYQDLAVQGSQVRKAQPGLTIDLCGIAKGHALDRIAAALTASGHIDALIEIGGEVRALGHHPDGRPWQVALLDPLAETPTARRIITPGPLALATSGPTENGLANGRVTASHIIDPSKGTMAPPRIASVSVLAPTGTRADAFATALCAAGPEAGIALAKNLDLPALFLLAEGPYPREVITGPFADHITA
ncbi:FAD:protein FMN transferase [Aestuariibius sp. 2305UL40-4]|uniref:FAD:protein FMN transferase n=1 Tax=Aestuariibius violaceus TaxID=3234132 RepID=UPI00345E1022